MTDADARLKAFLAEDAPGATDPRFRLAVLERIEKRQAARKLALVIGLGVPATVLAAILSPQLSHLAPPGAMLLVGAALGGAASLWALMQMRRPI